MNCQQAEEAMTVAVYGKPTDEETAALKEHLSRCAECGRRWEQTAFLREQAQSIPAVPLPDPDRSWAVISERLSKHRRRPKRIRYRRWAAAAATLLIVFSTGFFFGRRLFLLPPAGPAAPFLNLSEASLESYADFLQPILVNFLNKDREENSRTLERLEQSIVSDLLDRTRQLRSLLPEDGSSALQDLLQDLDFILTAMDNLEPGDGETARHLAGMIRDKQVSLRLHRLIRTQSTL
ncbi:MAG: zf-HC2 domain-containing protein [Candidatus Aminicenantes bacterium]|nr:zf-HC2 domain-containing protein [Candidatus Aminicenantes bacterium]